MLAAWTLRCNGTDLQSPRSISAPAQALGFGDTCTTSLRLRTRPFASVKAATRLAPLRSDLTAAAGPSLGSAKEPALTPAWRRLVGYQRHVAVLPVRPHDARARARILVALFALIDFVSPSSTTCRIIVPSTTHRSTLRSLRLWQRCQIPSICAKTEGLVVATVGLKNIGNE